MRPMTMVVGVLLGSSVAITLGLAVVAVIYLILGTDEPALRRELPALLRNSLIFLMVTAISAASFRAEWKGGWGRWPWRVVMAVVLAALVWHYWP